jgi:hypothetical protein
MSKICDAVFRQLFIPITKKSREGERGSGEGERGCRLVGEDLNSPAFKFN